MPADENFPPDHGADHTPNEPAAEGADSVSGEDESEPAAESGTEAESGNETAAPTGAESGTGAAAPAEVAPAPRRRRARRMVLWAAAGLAVVLTAGVATAYGYYHSLRSGMVQHDLESVLDEADRPERLSDAVNILFIGSDGYEEGSTAYQQEFEGERSDSIMLAHISPDDRVSVISFPRDSLVQLPQCDAYAQTEGTSGYFGMINAAMYHGGPPCVVRTVESLTDIRVDHFVHLSFMSFRDVVDAIGGVRMCIPEPMRDRRSHLDIDAGDQVLDGDQALSFVRARYEIGDGGDIGRIDRQQMFLGALADQVTSNDVLTSPTKLNGILEAVAQHSATDQELTLNKMLSVAVTLTDVDLSDIEFHTVPWYQAPYDPNRVMWYPEESEELFSAVREGRPLPPLPADEAGVPQERPGASPTPADTAATEEAQEAGEESSDSLNGGGRDATSNPCADGLGFGSGEDGGEDR
ncbi:LCP family protein [Nocardiopsis aegyptia]|uniref:LCP family protein required for cell wall assembly n=1 Tax=Nocardiopsis aegyptia TaxID=220378 RepID=A0A7Z0JAR8_9ACTN|nr:LCP family protein [Nocardiopsis aegyptia]NYJ35072.1 LCP family protein required for cell wall assembly [Nocardiopsis aegyptia]